MVLSTEHGFLQPLSLASFLRGWALAGQGQVEEGIVQMRQSLDAYRATGAEILRPYYLALLAEACGKAGQAAEGLAAIEEALALTQESGTRWVEAELYRIKGELLRQTADGKRQTGGPHPPAPSSTGGEYTPAGLLGTSGLSTVAPSSEQRERIEGRETAIASEAEACFLQAISVARGQSAKSWELRAVMSLSRLWQGQGKQAEARQMLQEIYGWFTEGFDTADLKDAKALIEALK